MVKVRRGIFETNSSSSHSLSIGVISNEERTVDEVPDNTLVLGIGEYGWEWEDYDMWYEKADYISILLGEEGIELIKKVIHKKFPNINLHFKFSGYIDHGSEYTEDWMKDEETLFIFFFGSGGVSTGNDNDDDNLYTQTF